MIISLRKELSGHGLDAGPETICWHLEHHHQIRVSRVTAARYLARAGLITPEPAKRPRSSYLRFVDEDITYAQRLMHANVTTELHVYSAAHHGFDRQVPTAAVSQRFIADRDAALHRAFSAARPGAAAP